MKWVQQGDILVKPVKMTRIYEVQLQRASKHRKPDGIVALGEHTGHMHKLVEGGDWTLYDDGEVMFIEVGPSGATMAHEEHGAVALDEGVYVVERVKTVDHFAASAQERARVRYVAD